MLRVPEAIHAELLNWARWAWTGPLPHPLPSTRCGSAEGRYITPPGTYEMDMDDLNRASRIRPNAARARVIHAIWEAMDKPVKDVIRAEYPQNDHQGYRKDRAQKLGMSVHSYEHFLQIGINQVEARIEVRA